MTSSGDIPTDRGIDLARLNWEDLFRDRIFPSLAAKGGNVQQPRWIFVCGHQGSGKSRQVRQLVEVLGHHQTQQICSDDLSTLLPEIYSDPDLAAGTEQLSEFQTKIRRSYIDRLADHAISLRSHVVWERPSPGDIEGTALVARSLGYRVECIVMAVSIVESWLATVMRRLAAVAAGELTVPAVSWVNVSGTYARWPAAVAKAEDNVLFDRIAVVDRDGDVCFENELTTSGNKRSWTEQPFAFESLMVERARPRSEGAIAAMVDLWQTVMAHPDVACRNQSAWPWSSITAFEQTLAGLWADRGRQFDLTSPGASSDPTAASRWIGQLRHDLDKVIAVAEPSQSAGLADRAQRLAALVSQVAGQPTR